MNTTDKRFQAAMAVMQGLCANTDFTSYSARQISAMAFRQADALLAELDRTETKQPEPAIPTPPKGFTVWGKGPLTNPSDTFIEDIAMICEDEWELKFKGNSAGEIYALRDGSDTQNLNGRVKP